MINLRWAPFPGADVVSYDLYRSMIGFKAAIVDPSLLSGLTLILKINGGAAQTITFDNSTPAVDKINATLKGAMAYLSLLEVGFFYVRNDVRSAPGSIQIFGGSALPLLGLVQETIFEKSKDERIAEIPALSDPSLMVSYEDPDGVCQDWYAVSTVSSHGEESRKSPYRQPVTNTGQLCVLEGIVTDLQGVRLPDAEVTATLVKFPQESEKATQISLDPIVTRSGSDGRFSLAVLQGALIQLDIPAVGFSRNITVPPAAYEFVTDILVDLDYRYPLEHNG